MRGSRSEYDRSINVMIDQINDLMKNKKSLITVETDTDAECGPCGNTRRGGEDEEQQDPRRGG